MLGLGINLPRRVAFGRLDELRALISQLFGNGEQGVVFIPQPTVLGQQVLYQDAAGTTPVSADGDPVGLMLDQSGNGNHASQSTSAARPLYKTDGTLHWLQFDGVDDSLLVAGPTITTQDILLIFAGEVTDDGSTQPAFGIEEGNSNRHTIQMSSAGLMRGVNSQGNFISVNGTASTGPKVTSWRRASTALDLWDNGVSAGSATQSVDHVFTSSSNVFIGRNPTFFLFAAMDFYGGAIVLSESAIGGRESMEAYLASLAGVTIS